MDRCYYCESTRMVAEVTALPPGDDFGYLLTIFQVWFRRFANNSFKVDVQKYALCKCEDVRQVYDRMSNFGVYWECARDFDEAIDKIALLATLPEVI